MSGAFRVLALDHVTVTAPEELERDTVAWYESCLGLERLAKPQGTRSTGAWFRTGREELHIAVHPHNPHKEAHFALAVDDLDSVVERLRTEGCHIEQAPTIPGRRRLYTRDPAGNRLEILAYDEPTTSVSYEEPSG